MASLLGTIVIAAIGAYLVHLRRKKLAKYSQMYVMDNLEEEEEAKELEDSNIN
jgi:hypothetical protein